MLRYVFLGFVLTAAIVGFRLATIETDGPQPLTSGPVLNDPTPNSQKSNITPFGQTAESSPETRDKLPHEEEAQDKYQDPVDLSEWAIESDFEINNLTPLSSDAFDESGEEGGNEGANKGENVDDVSIEPLKAVWFEPEIQPTLPDKYQQLGLPARAITFNQAEISTLRQGDQIALSIPQLNQTFNMEVERISRHSNGDKRLVGYILDEDSPYSVVMTRGENITFATINTPAGSFTLEAEGDQGWIMSAADLDYLINPGQEDFKFPTPSN